MNLTWIQDGENCSNFGNHKQSNCLVSFPLCFFSSVPEHKLLFGSKKLLSFHVIVSSLLNLVLRKFLISASQFNIHYYHNFATNAEGGKD